MSRHIAEVEAGRLRFFAKATSQTDPRYVNAAAALSLDPALPAPPTFLFCLDMDAPNPRALIELLDIDIGRVLHAPLPLACEIVRSGESRRPRHRT